MTSSVQGAVMVATELLASYGLLNGKLHVFMTMCLYKHV
jgi:hypothetical protein